MKRLSVLIALLFFTTMSSASILDFQNDFTKATGLCFKPKIAVKISNLAHLKRTKTNDYKTTNSTDTQITTKLKFFNYGVISAEGGIVFLNKINKNTDKYAKLTLDVKNVAGRTFCDKFPNIVDKFELAVVYGQKERIYLEFCLEI